MIENILASIPASKAEESLVWEQSLVECPHVVSCEQNLMHKYEGRSECMNCTLKENIWLCMVCGFQGCGRRQFDGSGGNNHALEHFESSSHNICVKLGSLSSEAAPDLYCYQCDEMRKDSMVEGRLNVLGVDLRKIKKTEKTMNELQIEYNESYEFSTVDGNGEEMRQVSGSFLKGLKNLGNSCYLASVLQGIIHMKQFQEAVSLLANSHFIQCTLKGPECILCQLLKIYNAVASDQSHQCLAPWMMKNLIGKKNSDFRNSQQQDSFELFQVLLQLFSKEELLGNYSFKLEQLFSFELYQLIECKNCHVFRVSKNMYTSLSLPIPEAGLASMNQLLDSYFCREEIDLNCPRCQFNKADKYYRISTFPIILAIQLQLFEFRNNSSMKKEFNLIECEKLTLQQYFLEAKDVPTDVLDHIDGEKLQMLLSMGFSENLCRKALEKFSDVESASMWILENLNSFNDQVDQNLKAMLVEAGFEEYLVEEALKSTSNDFDRAMDWIISRRSENLFDSNALVSGNFALKSFITHKGKSTSSGHYVCHVREESDWIMFNDEKVVVDPTPPSSKGYLFFYENK